MENRQHWTIDVSMIIIGVVYQSCCNLSMCVAISLLHSLYLMRLMLLWTTLTLTEWVIIILFNSTRILCVCVCRWHDTSCRKQLQASNVLLYHSRRNSTATLMLSLVYTLRLERLVVTLHAQVNILYIATHNFGFKISL